MQAQSTSDAVGQAETGAEEKKHQAKAPATQPFGKEAFEPSDATVPRWLGMARVLDQQSRHDGDGRSPAGRFRPTV
jgi:hypothetical protein